MARRTSEEGRHDLARRIFHGKRARSTAYYEGMEDQLSALGLVLNAWCYGTPSTWTPPDRTARGAARVRDEDVARLSPFVRHHINMLGRYSSCSRHLPGGLRGGLRALRDPSTVDADEEDSEPI